MLAFCSSQRQKAALFFLSVLLAGGAVQRACADPAIIISSPENIPPSPGSSECIVDLGCGCDMPGPGECGCDLSIVDLGCGCGEPPPGQCGCEPSPVDKYIYEVSIDDTLAPQGESVFAGAGATLSCLEQIVEQSKAGVLDIMNYPEKYTRPPNFDEILAALYPDMIGMGVRDAEELVRIQSKFALNQREANYVSRYISYIDDYAADALWLILGGERTGFLDSECKAVKNPSRDLICGQLKVTFVPSPISLLWTPGAGINDNISCVKFSLDPAKPNRYHAWKASADAPLLVFDPSRSGTVQSAKQLFGTWTFGGKEPENAECDGKCSPEKWRDGYEALAALDGDRDGKVSGAELDRLSLWFDANQDGTSQPGEVRGIKDEGVAALYYQHHYTDPVTGDIHAELGFERLVNGQLVKGSSVDWFSEGADSRMECMATFTARQSLRHLAKQPVEKHNHARSKQNGAPSAHLRDSAAEVWKWQLEDDRNDQYGPQGLLVFVEEPNGAISGLSLIESPLKSNPDSYRSLLSALPLSGTIETLADGRRRLTYEIQGQGGMKTKTQAYVSSDNRSIKGYSRSELLMGAKPAKKSAFNYFWEGQRIGSLS